VQLGLRPYDQLVAQTPLFRLRLGIAEYLFKNQDLLSETIECALYDKVRGGPVAGQIVSHSESMVVLGREPMDAIG
jgi:hypothetical protein